MSALRDIAIALKQVLVAPLDENCDAVDKLDAIRMLRELRAEGIIKFVEEVPQDVSPLVKACTDAGWTYATSDFTQQEARIHSDYVEQYVRRPYGVEQVCLTNILTHDQAVALLEIKKMFADPSTDAARGLKMARTLGASDISRALVRLADAVGIP